MAGGLDFRIFLFAQITKKMKSLLTKKLESEFFGFKIRNFDSPGPTAEYLN